MTIRSLALLLAAAGTLVASSSASHAHYRSDIPIRCDNGRDYALRPYAVTDRGDVVTGRLRLGRHRGVKVRLVPMGDGYRYAGRGVWLDGVGSTAALYIWKRPPIACRVD